MQMTIVKVIILLWCLFNKIHRLIMRIFHINFLNLLKIINLRCIIKNMRIHFQQVRCQLFKKIINLIQILVSDNFKILYIVCLIYKKIKKLIWKLLKKNKQKFQVNNWWVKVNGLIKQIWNVLLNIKER